LTAEGSEQGNAYNYRLGSVQRNLSATAAARLHQSSCSAALISFITSAGGNGWFRP
jgi:hypothetical protein